MVAQTLICKFGGHAKNWQLETFVHLILTTIHSQEEQKNNFDLKNNNEQAQVGKN